MATSIRSGGARLLAAAAFAIAPVVAFAQPAAAESFSHNFECSGESPLGAQEFSYQQDSEVTAPASVAPGEQFQIVIDPAVNTVPTEVNGFGVEQIGDLDLKLPIPENSTHVSTTQSGGSNLGSPAPTIDVSDGIATLHVSGPISGGAEFELPTVTATLQAGDSGAIETHLYGDSYDNPGLTFNAQVSSILGSIDVPTSCYPSPNPVLTTTDIS
ncbi:dehydratase [Actinopolyspora xinjiangensis]|uniref:Dehydratase n=1 Tax=Actinopolyspora xinjiangensis TaxID=405564 RepID=A0A1H0WV78_9ACTN|nr:cyclase [Actinopolyspora xinjiangensis]SDP94674.1 dehydratase [Actinopolyspora xinjiangensis]